METAAIYARKSVFSDRGESIQNQIDRCKAYANMKNWKIKIYFDEDYSGKDLNRPQFQNMLNDIENGIIQNVIFYRLDRISRKVTDIIDFIESLNQKNIGFISLSENFDTTTPIGRAMLLITAVFAQLERETIADRVKDNMMDLAKKGHWNGGVPPLGYKSKKILKENEKKITILEIIPKDATLVKNIFYWYINGMTLKEIAIFLNKNNIKNRNWSTSTLHRILHNPIFCIADKEAFEYFLQQGMNVVGKKEDWNGNKGVMVYNKSHYGYKKGKNRWIVSIGYHEGIIPGKLFSKVESLLSRKN